MTIQSASMKVPARDDHSLCECGDGSFMVFGGFVNGFRCDDLLRFKPSNINVESEHIAGGSTKIHGPKPRTSHASGYSNGHFYVYGG